MNERQKKVLRNGVGALAENAQEDVKNNGDDHGVYGLEDDDRHLSWSRAVEAGKDTLVHVIKEDGVQGALEECYMFDDEDEPTGIEKVAVAEIEAYVTTLMAGADEEVVERS